MRWPGHVARLEEMINTYKLLVGKSEVERPLRRPRRKWEHNIKVDLKECGKVWTGFILFRIGTSGGLLRTRG